MPPFFHRDFGANDGGDPELTGRSKELRDAVEAVPVRKGQRAHPHAGRCLDQLVGRGHPETVGEAAPDVQVDEPPKLRHQSTTPTRNHPPDRSRVRSTTPPPESRTLKTNLSLRRYSCHHHPTSLQRSMTLTTCRSLQKEYLLPLPNRTTSTRPEDLFS